MIDHTRPGGAPKVHFSGIGGTAMVAGARLAIEAGWTVRGSDNPLYPPTSEMVAALGVPVAAGYAAENLDWGPDLVVVGNALSRGNPEVEAVLSRGLRYVSLPEWLKDAVLRARRPVAICGTHGKTTTTALTAHLLDQLGLGNGFLIGGQPLGFSHSARLGREGAPFVIEGDEYDTAFFDKRAKFFHYLPETAVVTSIEFDHGDIYHDIEEIEIAFQRMLRQIPAEGVLIACADDPGAAALTAHAFCPAETYGLGASATWRGEVLPPRDVEGRRMQRMHVRHNGMPWHDVDVPMAGHHNLRNALAAIAVAARYGGTPGAIAAALRSFPGIRRRMDVFLEARGVTYVDDFAHHPTAIRETIAAARMHWPEARLRVLFEPRSNTTVTRRFQGELATAFAGADEVWLGPIHRAEAIPELDRLDRAALAEALTRGGTLAHAPDSAAAIAEAVLATRQPGDLVLILSNGAFGGIYDLFRRAEA